VTLDVMSGLTSSLARIAEDRPVAVFAPLALFFSWGVWAGVFSQTPARSPAWLLGVGAGAFGPGVASAVVLRLRGESVRAWLTGRVSSGRPLRWAALALAVPVVAGAGVAVVVFTFEGIPAAGAVAGIAPVVVFNLVLTTLWTGGNEEFGWRGFALPHLQTRYSALTSGLLVGGLWAVWHVPLFVYDVYTMSPATYAVGVLCFSVVLTWYHNTTGGWLPGAVLFHGGINTFANVPQQALGGVDALDALPVSYHLVMTLVWVVLAGVLLFRYGPGTLTSGDVVGPVLADHRSTTDTVKRTRGRSRTTEEAD
jgi:membrane protease YdiL (CAAX protease family)